MTKRPYPAVGIDLGTTYTVAARLDDVNRPCTLINAEGDRLTPSVVLLDEGEIVIGKEAVKAMGTEMERVAEGAKRDVGQRMFHRALGGRRYPPETIEAWVLDKVRRDTRDQIGDSHKVVITVPAYFDEVRRKATQDAGYIAGFEVLDIINEPTAAAVAFGFQHGYLSAERRDQGPRRILVYDLGGGTFDVTLMQLGGRDFVALATDGDVQLGGRDWDQRLVDCVAEEFIREHGLDPREDQNVEGQLLRECEDAKRTLSSRSAVNLSCQYRGKAISREVTREEFEDMTLDLLDRTSFTTRQTLKAAGFEWSDIDRILLVGGSTRMPSVRRMLQDLSGIEPDRSVSPDEAVAHGAALHAGLLLDKHEGRVPQFQVRNVNSHSLGVVATESQTKRVLNAVLIPRNTPLPAEKKKVFRTQKHGQRSVLVRIVEGEATDPDHCSQIGKCSIRDLPAGLAKNTPIEVGFRYLENGRLNVRVKVAGTGKLLRHEIVRDNSLTQEQLNGWRRYISGLPPLAQIVRHGEKSSVQS
ncbi:MAG: Hsp70 family protein [Planctomycetota bacterium]